MTTVKTSPIDQSLALAQLTEALRLIKQTTLVFKRKQGAVAVPGAMPPVGKLYEAWAMVRLAFDVVRFSTKAKSANITWHLSDSTDATAADTVIFRGGPALLHRTHSIDEPGYLSIDDRHNPVLEIHSSLQFKGWSGAWHELDLAVLFHDVMEAWRNDPKKPEWTGLDYIAAVELKCHGKSTEVGLVRQAALTRMDLAARFSPQAAGWASPIAAFPAPPGWVYAKDNALHIFVSVQPLSESGCHISAAYRLWPVTMSPGYPMIRTNSRQWKAAVCWVGDHY